MRISIIIPVYQVENYLEECIESIVRQSYEEKELILVDDGSTDQSPFICDRYAGQYEWIHVLHKQNEGCGMARNSGIKMASGDYVCFVDGDDCLDGSDALSALAEKAVTTGADIVVGNFSQYIGGKKTGIKPHHLESGQKAGTREFRFKGFYQYGHLAYMWGKLYKREFLNQYKLRNQSYTLMQDKAFNFRCYANHPRYELVEESVYLYRENEVSATHRYQENLGELWVSVAEDFFYYLKKRHLLRQYVDLCDLHVFFGCFYLAKQEYYHASTDKFQRMKAVLKRYAAQDFTQQAMKRLAWGVDTKEMNSPVWTWIIRGFSVLFCFHCYGMLTLGMMQALNHNVDKKITAKRHKKL